MGRHSAQDDDGDVLVDAPAPVRPRPRPRHAVSDATDTDTDTDADAATAALAAADTDVIDPELVERALDEPPRNVVDAVVVEDEAHSVRARSSPGDPLAELPARPAPAPRTEPQPAPTRRERAGRADVRLLRENSSLRARCLAAVLLPFVLYTIALVVIDRVDVYLFWIWIPAILAGVLFGAQLDGAHRAATAATAATAADPAAPPTPTE